MADRDADANPGHAMFGLNEPEPRKATPSDTAPAPPAGTPQYIYVQGPPPGKAAAPAVAGGKALTWLVIVLLLISAANLYLVISSRSQFNESLTKHSDQLDLLTRRLDSSDARYAQLSGKFQVTTERLGLTQQELSRARSLAKDIQTQQQAAVKQLNDAIAKKAGTEELNKLQEDTSAKMGGISTDLAGTKKDLEATKEALMGTKGELTSAIARTHDELVELAHRTDRDYFEFKLQGKKGQQKVGTITLQLSRTDPKKNLFAINLVFDDKSHPHKDRTINEPLYFYMSGAPSALELVVNKLAKDSIAGYISTPKGFFPSATNVLGSRPAA